MNHFRGKKDRTHCIFIKWFSFCSEHKHYEHSCSKCNNGSWEQFTPAWVWPAGTAAVSFAVYMIIRTFV